jgi:hypothetical protein
MDAPSNKFRTIRPADIDPRFNWGRRLPALGTMAVTFEERVNYSRLHEYTIPHFYLTADITIDALIAVREQVNAAAPKDRDGKPLFKLSLIGMAGGAGVGWRGYSFKLDMKFSHRR